MNCDFSSKAGCKGAEMERSASEWADRVKTTVGGQSDLIDTLIASISQFLNNEEQRHAHGFSNVLGIFLEGFTGTGKNHLTCTLSRESGLSWNHTRAVDLYGGDRETEKMVYSLLLKDSAVRIHVIEDVELLAGKQTDDSFDKNVKAAMDHCFGELSKNEKATVIIGISSNPERVDPNWLCGTRFGLHHKIALSTPNQRKEILSIILNGFESNVIEPLSACTHGYTVADLMGLKFQAFFLSKGNIPNLETFREAMAVVKPSLMAEYYRPPPTQSLNDIFGIDKSISHLKDQLLLPVSNADLAEKYGVKLPSGILIHGPAGSGKTHLAMGLVREAGLNYIPISAPAIRSKYVGQSEKNLAAVFKLARDCAPSILVIDHIDGLVTKRGAESTSSDGSANRLITCFLTEMDGLIAKDSKASVVVIGITDSPSKLDPAMLRPGRLSIHVEMPSTLDRSARESFIRRKKETKMPLALTDKEIMMLVEKTEGYNGALLESLLMSAAMNAIDDEDGTIKFSHILPLFS